MKYKFAGIVAALSAIVTVGVQAVENNKAEEPVQNAILVVDGKKHQVVIGRPSQIRIGEKPYRINLEISPYKKFNKAGISFIYTGQRHFSYDRLGENVDHWSLDGNNSIIMVQHYAVPVSRKEILSEFQKQFRKMNAEITLSSASLSYGKGKLDGNRLKVKFGNVMLSQDIFVIPGNSASRTLILQDTLTKQGANTDEYVQARKQLEGSLAI